ncbi:hypothetical protein F5148DRAFT_1282522 [Russula earlei]|uniref:Uncharacterized protein n=1 Tax=Russula earlei TaxID=71964 RepID=A0ACC0UEW7_9AGAM|nr:hypothetical protein F5148DRAFT_1282522 [Russula earlei]
MATRIGNRSKCGSPPFAKEGTKVVVSDLDEKKAQAVADEIKVAGGNAIAVGGVALFMNVFSTRYDKLVHSGPFGGLGSPATACSLRCIITKAHVRPPFRLIRVAAPLLHIKAEPGKPPENLSIINVSSISGLYGNVGQANDAVAKSAISEGVGRLWRPRRHRRVW